MSRRTNALARVFHERALMVLVLFVILLLLDPFFPPSVASASFLAIAVVSAWLVSGPGGISRKAVLVLSCAIAGMVLYTRALPTHPSELVRESIGIMLLLLALTLYALCGSLILRALLGVRHVTHHLILSAVNLYILVGVCWAHIYTLLDYCDPRAFTLSFQQNDSASHFVYFSFVTLASLGYGDITPKTELAQRLTVIEAIMGQFYGSVVVAYLMSVYIGQTLKKDSPSHGDGSPEHKG